MKGIFLLTIASLISLSISAQCKVQTNQRDDGVTVSYLSPERIGFSDKLILALSMQTNGELFFVTTLSIFETNAIKLKGNLTLKFENNKSSTFQHYTSQLTTYKGFPATISIFIADKNGLTNISNSNVTMAMLQLSNDVYQSIIVKMNGDILKKHYYCLK